MTNLPTDLKYAPSHEWARLENDNTVRVGITDFAQQELGDLVFIELPELGRKLAAQEQCAVVESVKTASDLFSPVSGEVLAVNTAVIDEPELVNDDAYGAWLFCIKADDLTDLDQLMSGAEYQNLIND
ncbi:glycine cleavage system H protein GcvH [Methyloglobulus morosus KoM1]|uniref:Glycine cleavage system H protein n=1 Tax=Methyloglobulus morosus KoM1 TaxID=1116472 RepID=V5C179_9GAMM|nr:glycine cleavage system protein GcvH [Methyloglobulus morosus]ESS72222.1 glycine cleavage system H protein GcvH [Methyloglobulus morosus KoM1]